MSHTESASSHNPSGERIQSETGWESFDVMVRDYETKLANKQETILRLQRALHDALEKIDRLEDPEEK